MDFIDIRSDTVTHPTEKMREMCLTAEIGDHSYGEDPTVIQLEQYAASIMGKQAASFVPSGCFGNQCVFMAAAVPLGQILLPDKSHIIEYEQGSAASLARSLTRIVPTDENILMPVQTVRKMIRKVKDNQAPRTYMLEIENPTKIGSVYPLQHFRQLVEIGHQQNLHVHLDGARIFNACQKLQIDPKQLVSGCTTVMFCLSKGLCSPIGSMVVGSKQFIKKFNIYKKMLGGFMRKPGMFAAMGLISLKQMVKYLKDDHRIAQELAYKLSQIEWINLVRQPQTNMIFIKFSDERVKKSQKKLEDYLLLQKKIKTDFNPDPEAEKRIVVHHYIREKQIETIISGFQDFYAKHLIQ